MIMKDNYLYYIVGPIPIGATNFKLIIMKATYQDIMLSTQKFNNVEYPYAYNFFLRHSEELRIEAANMMRQSDLVIQFVSNSYYMN